MEPYRILFSIRDPPEPDPGIFIKSRSGQIQISASNVQIMPDPAFGSGTSLVVKRIGQRFVIRGTLNRKIGSSRPNTYTIKENHML